jgi:hypothetical protein
LLRGHSTHTAPDLNALGDATVLYCNVARTCHACGSATGRPAHVTSSAPCLFNPWQRYRPTPQPLTASPSWQGSMRHLGRCRCRCLVCGCRCRFRMSMSMSIYNSMSVSNVDVDVDFEFDVDFDVWFVGSEGRPAKASAPPPPPTPPAQSQRQGSKVQELHATVITCTLCWRCRRQSKQ